MNYHEIYKNNMLNGDGLRVVLWTAGCEHRCPKCQNPFTHDPDGGLPFDDNAKNEIFDQLDKDYISGITFSGETKLSA
jgi:anaerobic ribonucleoside-triphosphate reductase activating protein